MHAQRTSCANNIKQLVMATLLYDSDSQGYSFPSYTSTIDGSGSGLWMGDLIYYDAKVEKVRLCPSAPKTNNPNGASIAGACDTSWVWATTVTAQPYLVGSFAFNGWMYSGDTTQIAQFRTDISTKLSASYVFNKESAVQKPSQTPIICDSVWVDLWPVETDRPNINLYLAGGTENPPEIERVVTPRHGWKDPGAAPRNYNYAQKLPGGVDIGLVDGHVEQPKLDALWSYSWHLNWNAPNPRPGLH
jgi:hypothetical protein